MDFSHLHRTSKGLEYKPDTIGIGFYGRHTFACTVPRKAKPQAGKEDIQKELSIPAELAIDANCDLNDCKKSKGSVATKILCGKRYVAQTMIDSEFVMTSAFTYKPSSNHKFIWSDQINLKKLFTNPKEGVDYKYGFTFEFDFD